MGVCQDPREPVTPGIVRVPASYLMDWTNTLGSELRALVIYRRGYSLLEPRSEILARKASYRSLASASASASASTLPTLPVAVAVAIAVQASVWQCL